MVILVDSDIIIDFLRTRKKETLFYQYFYLQDNTSAASLTTVTEIWQGKSMNDLSHLKSAEELLKRFKILIPNIEIAKKAGKLLRNLNYQISFQDAEIAACSLYYSLPLLTKNRKDFLKIKGLLLIKS